MASNEQNATNSTTNGAQAMTNGANIVVQALINCGVKTVFAYPGGFSIPLHQAFTRYRDQIRVVLPRHEQGGGFAAQGYARATGEVGVCMTTSGPGLTNIITSVADAKLDSVPLVLIAGQVNLADVGSDSFQETPTTEVCRCITKHHYLVQRVEDLARVVDEAIFVAKSGRPGPVLIDIPKNLQVEQCYPNFAEPRNLPGYPKKNPEIDSEAICDVVERINAAKRPLILAGGGVVSADACALLRNVVEKTGIPVATTMTGLAGFPRDDKHAVGMVGMHGTYATNMAARECDLLLALGVRFSDRVVGARDSFAPRAQIIHFDVDPSEFNKVKKAKRTVLGHLKDSLAALDSELARSYKSVDLTDWRERIAAWRVSKPVQYSFDEIEKAEDLITPQYAISEFSKATQDLDTIVTTGVGQHQMWTTLFYRFNKPRTWISSCGLGTMGFGLPAAIGAKVARPESLVVAVEGDGSLQMNIQEMATCVAENIPVKVLLVNNQHLGMVMQWEDRFFKKNRANTYLGKVSDPENFGG
ncbi:MAG: biosynthetic-type acetolactate synthase large subunit, partial [Thermoguttaceae bacterium]|nr:biosynthetic-type acetolactate synthase large subunit [Thermoguttaceae bacterium]